MNRSYFSFKENSMKLKVFKGIGLIIFTIVIGLLTGCRGPTERNRGYTGDYPELFTVAINSLLGTEGFISCPSGF